MSRGTWCRLVGAAALAVAAPGAALAAPGAVVVAERPEPLRATIDYRLVAGGAVDRIAVRAGERSVRVLRSSSYPYEGATTAVLLLVDTSRSRSAATLRQNARDIARIVEAAKPHERLGLAALDTTLRVLAPLGSSRDAMLAATRQLTVEGLTTELFRHTLTAIEMLRTTAATRRAVFVFSDGGAEDTAYSLDDVVRAATASHVAIFGLGFPEKVSLSVQLQTLRRLSEGTNGRYVQADAGEALPDGFVRTPFAALDGGGRVEVDLSPLASLLRPVATSLHVALATDEGPVETDLPIAVPRRRPAPAEVAGVLVALGGVAAVGVTTWRRRRPKPEAAPASPLAYLEFLDGDGSVVPMTTSQLTIGRSGDGNGLQLANETVSAHHAAIVRRRDGGFAIREILSTNGVRVNDRRVTEAPLADGDVVALGEVRFRFRPAVERGGEP